MNSRQVINALRKKGVEVREAREPRVLIHKQELGICGTCNKLKLVEWSETKVAWKCERC